MRPFGFVICSDYDEDPQEWGVCPAIWEPTDEDVFEELGGAVGQWEHDMWGETGVTIVGFGLGPNAETEARAFLAAIEKGKQPKGWEEEAKKLIALQARGDQ